VTYTRYAETNLKIWINLSQLIERYSRSIVGSSEIECFKDREMMVYNNPLEFMMFPINICRSINGKFIL
jgi:hypothetical protein